MTAGVARVLVLLAACTLLACARGRAAPDTYQGVVELEERRMAFEVPGRLVDIPVARGQAVAAGATLAVVDDALARSQRDARAAEARAARAQAALLAAGSRAEDVRAAVAQLEGARAAVELAERNLVRQRSLVAQGASGKAQLDELEAQLERTSAEERVLAERLRALRLGSRAQELEAADARAVAATHALAMEEERLARHRLVADRAGTVVGVHAEPGETIAAGTPVVTLADTSHPHVDVFVPQGQLAGIVVGVAATVRVDGEPVTFAGRVEDVARKAEFTPRFLFSPRERPNLVIRVRVRIEDPAERLHAGVPAAVTIQRGDARGR